ncbi:MAG: DUF1653 domain-containing protein [Clostridia bacterium]|nr:DUF1653 domain-containing protein [[Bacteroides] pectinophilus]MDD5872490.1 DUF1653 domain-containing protein [Clostridia bacterium]
MREVLPGEFYRHFKNKLYQIKGIAYHSETKEKMVVYQAMYGDFKWYVRPYDMFISEVDHEKYPDVKQLYRFEKVTPETENQEPEKPDNVKAEQIKAEPETIKSDTASQAVQADDMEYDESGVNPALIKFLDAEDYREKLNVLTAIRAKLDDRLVDDIATSMDITVPDGSIDERFMSLKACILAHAKYEESNRLR